MGAVDTGAAGDVGDVGDVGDAVMVAFPREWLHNHFLGNRGVKMQVNSRDYRPGFLRVAASSNSSIKPTRSGLQPPRAASVKH